MPSIAAGNFLIKKIDSGEKSLFYVKRDILMQIRIYCCESLLRNYFPF